jgi:hypothetical protein
MFFLELLFEDLPTPTSWESPIFNGHAHSVRGSTGAIEQLEKSRNAAKNTCVSLGASTRLRGTIQELNGTVVEVRGDLTKSRVDLQGATQSAHLVSSSQRRGLCTDCRLPHFVRCCMPCRSTSRGPHSDLAPRRPAGTQSARGGHQARFPHR